MKTMILYASTHHGNTERVVRAAAEILAADVADIVKASPPDLSGYDCIGLASGIYFGAFHEKIRAWISGAAFGPRQTAFLIYTCGINYTDYTKSIQKQLKEKGISCVGSFSCRGYDTFGIFGRLGGIAKGRPSDRDLEKAKAFARSLL